MISPKSYDSKDENTSGKIILAAVSQKETIPVDFDPILATTFFNSFFFFGVI